jgi:hypothetical protein
MVKNITIQAIGEGLHMRNNVFSKSLSKKLGLSKLMEQPSSLLEEVDRGGRSKMGKKRTTIRVEKMGGHYSVRRRNPNGTCWTLPNGQTKTKPEAIKLAKKLRKEKWRWE